jgi:uncharacterized membrane protein YeaQ/YmgE (transglycosylase-associated protein family)
MAILRQTKLVPEETPMHLSNESLVVILLVGAIAGWLAGRIIRGVGFGLIGDIIIGILGALVASLLFPRIGVHLGTGMAAEIIAATIGALVLLIVVRLTRRAAL